MSANVSRLPEPSKTRAQELVQEMLDAPRMFPIMCGQGSGQKAYIPWGVIAAHEPQALKNHYQTLNRLAERGGLSIHEAIAVILDTDFYQSSARNLSVAEAWRFLWLHALKE